MEGIRLPEQMVFGLDIGTRSIVGTVGFRQKDSRFMVAAQTICYHETRAMLDGQIHDIGKVADTITSVRKELERQLGRKLSDVCIAAAGRVLKTVTVKVDYDLGGDVIIEPEHIRSLELIGVEKAHAELREKKKKEEFDFFCVGYSIVRYYLNGYAITNLEGHKGNRIAAEVLATFLPGDVIDGLYAAVERTGLKVVNLTLEPIAAIQVAIPEKYRLLNIALVDVGAGTSDISITKGGAIVAYGMISCAGDAITEQIMQQYLVEFQVAEQMKIDLSVKKKSISYVDVMGLRQSVSVGALKKETEEAIQMVTKKIADCIVELNGKKTVSAVFIVGGGGKIPSFSEKLAKHLNLQKERVALRGEEVLGDITFLQSDAQKDSILVTPIGICLNYYEQNNNFIFVQVNGERVKLYDNSKLMIVDAALSCGFPNELLFPRRGKALNYTLNGKARMVRGEQGEAAVILLNGKQAGISSSIIQNDVIEIQSSTVGADAVFQVGKLPEYKATITFLINGKKVVCPKFIMANGQLVSEYYEIQEGDQLEILDYYLLDQVLEFMDLPKQGIILVNNIIATGTERVYENFYIDFELEATQVSYDQRKSILKKNGEKSSIMITVLINEKPQVLVGKPNYIIVDAMDAIQFDVASSYGKQLILKVNDQPAEFSTPIQEGDKIELLIGDMTTKLSDTAIAQEEGEKDEIL